MSEFLDKDLLPQIKAAFTQHRTADRAETERYLATAIEQAHGLGVDPETTERVKTLRDQLRDDVVDINALEGDVYDHLFRFFRRYYSEGDFLTKRVYKPGVYAIPYEGDEVTLHWVNKDQYYIKTNEYLRDYAFRLRPNDKKAPMRVHFRLANAAEGEHGNVKATAGKERLFVLATPTASRRGFLAEEHGEHGKELVIFFEYRPATLTDWPEEDRAGKTKPPVQKDLSAFTARRILTQTDATLTKWIAELGATHVMANGEPTQYSRLEAHLKRYVARNTFDYFIHKDLGTFLRRELDFYIKNEVMHLDDVENESAPRVEQYLSKIKVIRRIAGKIIDFLSQLENFQKKLWLKKKFVVETQYCIAVDRVPEEFYPEIAANEAQREEWATLFTIDEIMGAPSRPSRCKTCTPDFLQVHPTLLVDTRHFDSHFTQRLLERIDNIDEQTDGVLFHGDNFQSLAIMQDYYRRRIDCVYIDPPYNTGDSEIPYKNTYLHSSWLTLMANRLALVPQMLTSDPVLFVAIDDLEMANLAQLIDSEHASFRREMIIINHHPQGGKAKTLAHTHEYMLACVPSSSDRTLVGRIRDEGVERRPFKRSGTAESNFRYGRPNSFYAVLVNSRSRQVVGLEPPPPVGNDYSLAPTAEQYIRVYPIGADGEERVWRRSYESCLQLVKQEKLVCTEGRTIYQLIEAKERAAALFSNWVDPRYNSGTFGANLLRDIIGEQNPFSYPKSVHTVEDAIFAAGLDEGTHIVDFFAGSGTTGHSIINLNREDGRRRKFILVEMGDYFDTVLLPRIKKVTFTPEWKNGKPRRLATSEEAQRGPRILKIVRLESYEDALNNLEPRRTERQQLLLESAETEGAGGLREQYILRYLLNVETRGSQSLLNVQAFKDPTAYRLKVKWPGSDESREVDVDLLETFNWLIGLRVEHIAAPQIFVAAFERDDEGRLQLAGRLEQEKAGPYWFRTVTGATPDGRRTLVIWRKLAGESEEDNLVLNEWFTRHGYSARDSEFDLIYVNGGNNLENLKTADDLWKVRLIEEDFHRLMFEMEDA